MLVQHINQNYLLLRSVNKASGKLEHQVTTRCKANSQFYDEYV